MMNSNGAKTAGGARGIRTSNANRELSPVGLSKRPIVLRDMEKADARPVAFNP
jgi:hypothetical protein